MKNKKIILGSLAIMLAIGTFTLNMTGCSGDSNESKEIEQISFQKRGDGFEGGKSVGFFKDAVERINKNPKKLREIIKEHLAIGSNAVVTQELLNAVQNEIGVVLDLPLDDINGITNSLFQFMVSGADLDNLMESSNLNPIAKAIFTQVFTSGGVEDLSVFEGYNLLSDRDKEFLDLANYMAGNNAGVTTNWDIDCSIFGVPTDCWMAGGVGGAIIGGYCCGPGGAVVGAVIGAVVGVVADIVSK